MNCKRCGAQAEAVCQPEYYRWSTDRTNGIVDYVGSGLCNACFKKDARRAALSAHVPVCPYCGADVVHVERHAESCSYKGRIAAEAQRQKEER